MNVGALTRALCCLRGHEPFCVGFLVLPMSALLSVAAVVRSPDYRNPSHQCIAIRAPMDPGEDAIFPSHPKNLKNRKNNARVSIFFNGIAMQKESML